MNDLTTFQRDMLYVIVSMGDPYGLAIKRGLQEYYGEEVNHGRLYPNLDTLVSKGLVAKDRKDRRTNEYRLTQRGKDEIAARRAWENKLIQNGNENYDGVADEDGLDRSEIDTEEYEHEKSARRRSPTSALLDEMEEDESSTESVNADAGGDEDGDDGFGLF